MCYYFSLDFDKWTLNIILVPFFRSSGHYLDLFFLDLSPETFKRVEGEGVRTVLQ